MVGYTLGEGSIGGRGEVDGAPCGVLLLKILQKFAVVRQVSNV